jgi:hypothetical protein
MATGWIVFACVFGGVLLGIILRSILPDHHLSSESKDVIKLAMGMLATVAALVLGLLITSAKSSYDTRSSEITVLAANVALLDSVMAHYGPETRDVRDSLRRSVARIVDQMWPHSGSQPAELDPEATRPAVVYKKIMALSPHDEAQRTLRADALRIATDVGRTLSLLLAQGGSSIPLPFLVILVFWVTVIFVSFALYAPPNPTLVVALFIVALSVSAAIFLIRELDDPFQGFIQVSSAPLRTVLMHLGQ